MTNSETIKSELHAEVKERKGIWIDSGNGVWFNCSECNYETEDPFNFCPFCGAKMG